MPVNNYLTINYLYFSDFLYCSVLIQSVYRFDTVLKLKLHETYREGRSIFSRIVIGLY